MGNIELRFGHTSPPPSSQLKGSPLSDWDLNHYDEDARAILRLYIRGLIPGSVRDRAFRKLTNRIARALAQASNKPNPTQSDLPPLAGTFEA